MIDLNNMEIWLVTGSQNLYGEETLKQVASDSQNIAGSLNYSDHIPVKFIFKTVVTSAEEILSLCMEANSNTNCIGVVTWMHTFSPAKMWIAGLKILNKPILHLHTQFNRDIPYSDIDMDYMNLHQSAHGGREYGFMLSRLRKERKVIVGHWKEKEVQGKIGVWSRAAAGWHDWQGGKVARFGDNMREVAVTEGDKVEAQIKMGFSVNGYGVGDLVKILNEVANSDIDKLVDEYAETYIIADEAKKGSPLHENVRVQARYELGIKTFLREGGFNAFTTTFEDLHGMKQLPGLAVQRLMIKGYGFGAEGDWKHAALVRAMKVMSAGLEGGTSFMEDYTYHMDPQKGMKVLGAHMLEICPSIAAAKPRLEVHPLSIGGKADPARLVFNVSEGTAVNASIVDMGNRFRMIVNPVDVVKPDDELPKLPVARALWIPRPDLQTGAAAWILAGGAHHTSFSMAINTGFLEDFAEMAGIELVVIDDETRIQEFKKELRWNEMYYMLSGGLK
jgi:L-arabinose isomerase